MNKPFNTLFLTQPITNDTNRLLISIHPVHMADSKVTIGDYVEIRDNHTGKLYGVFEIHPQPSATRNTMYIYKSHGIECGLQSSCKVKIIPITKAIPTLSLLKLKTSLSSQYYPLILHQLKSTPLHPEIKPIISINGDPLELDIDIQELCFINEDTLIQSTLHSPYPIFYSHIVQSILCALKVTPPNSLALRSFNICGPSGTGKSVLVHQIAEQTHRNLIVEFNVNGDIKECLQHDIQTVLSHPHDSVFLIDNIDLLPNDCYIILRQLDFSDVLLLTTSVTKVKYRFDRIYNTSVPSPSERVQLIHQLIPDLDCTELNEMMSGYTHKDIATVISQSDKSLSTLIPLIKKHPPSGLSEITLNIPQVSWDQIGGNEEIKQRLKEAVQWPLRFKEQLDKFHVRPTRGILLHGPPGNSKTMQAKALASEAKCNFLAVKGPEMLSKYVGETEGKIKEIFMKARQNAPCVIFFDEIDGMLGVASERGKVGYGDRMLSQFLVEMDGLKETRVLVLAATNRPDLLDEALLRPGRFDRILYVGLPDLDTRKQIVKIYANSVNIELWANNFKGYSGAEIAGICREAALESLRNNKENIDETSLMAAWMKYGLPQTQQEVINLHLDFQKTHKMQGF
ncbi:hypothetical protein ENUP19_0083G0131 [Entamoeba nuttalli]